MKDIIRLFNISMAGMDRERLRLEMSASRMAQANSPSGQLRPGTPVTGTGHASRVEQTVQAFESQLGSTTAANIAANPRHTTGLPPLSKNPMSAQEGSESLLAKSSVPDSAAYTSINPVEEMISIMTAVRVYEANVRAFNASRGIALKALEIGAPR